MFQFTTGINQSLPAFFELNHVPECLGSRFWRDDCIAWALAAIGPAFLYSGRLPVPFIGQFLSRPGPQIYSEVTSRFIVCSVAVCDSAEVKCVNTHRGIFENET